MSPSNIDTKCLTILIITLVAFVAADEEWKPPPYETVDALLKECDKDLTPEQKIIIDNDVDDVDSHENTLCRFKKMGIFSEENGFIISRLMASLTAYNFDAEQSRERITKCIETNKKTSTVAEWAYRTYTCIRKVKLVQMKRKH